MAFTLTLRIAGRSFQLVRQLLLLDDELPFAGQLTVKQIEAAFRAEGYAFDDDDTQDNDDAVYTMPVVMWAFLSQMMFTLEERSCLAAVKRIASYYAASHGRICSPNTGAYCRARARVPIKVVRRLTREMAAGCEVAVHGAGMSEGKGSWRRALVIASVTNSSTLRPCWRQVSRIVCRVSTKRLPPAL